MSLIAWYPLDGNAEDYTVNRNHGTPTNVTWVNGKIGQAGSFNGSSSKVDLGNNYNINLKEFSVAVWFKIVSNHFSRFVSKNGVSDGWFIGTEANGNYNFGVGGIFSANVTGPYNDNVWHHAVLTFDRTSIKFYVDKVLKQTLNATSISNTDITTSYNTFIGCRNNTSAFFNGQINDVRIYDHALSQKEINDLAKAKILHYTFNKDEDIVYDGSGLKNNGIKVDSPLWSEDTKLGNGSYYFNGTSKILVDPLIEITGDYTVSYWWKTSLTANYRVFDGQYYTHSIWHRSATQITLDDRAYSGITPVLTFSPGAIQNEWTNLVIRKIGTTVDGFMNGIKSTNSITVTEILKLKYIGWKNENTGWATYQGYVDDVKIYKEYLSDSDILDLYQTRAKIDNQGNLYANEIVEDYEIQPGLTLRELFEEYTFNSINLLEGYDISYPNDTSSSTDIYRRTDGETLLPAGNFVARVTNPNLRIRLVNESGSPSFTGTPYYYFTTTAEENSYFNFRNATATSWLTEYGETLERIGFYIINLDHFSTNPDLSQMDAWYRDYSRVRPNAKGQMIAHELNEVGIDTIVYEGKSYRDIFETNNISHTSTFTTQTSIQDFGDYIRIDTNSTDLLHFAGLRYNSLFPLTTNDILYVKVPLKDNSGMTNKIGWYFESHTPYHQIGYSALKLEDDSSMLYQRTSNMETYNYINLTFWSPDENSYFEIFKPYIIKVSSLFTTVPTKAQMDSMYLKYRQLKITNQKQRITKDMIVIDGEFKEV